MSDLSKAIGWLESRVETVQTIVKVVLEIAEGQIKTLADVGTLVTQAVPPNDATLIKTWAGDAAGILAALSVADPSNAELKTIADDLAAFAAAIIPPATTAPITTNDQVASEVAADNTSVV